MNSETAKKTSALANNAVLCCRALCSLLERFSFECEKVIGFAFAFGFHAT